VLLGAYYAATDGVLAALASRALPADVRATGLALLSTGVGLGRLLASVVFGAFWAWWGPGPAVATFGCALAISLAIASARLRVGGRLERQT
jgi:hypothetical protein